MRYSGWKNSVTLKNRLGVVKGHWKWCRSIDHIYDFLLVRYWKLYLVTFLRYSTLSNTVPWSLGFRSLARGHSNWYHSMSCYFRRWISHKRLKIRPYSYYERRTGNCTQAFERYQFKWPSLTYNPDLKVTIN